MLREVEVWGRLAEFKVRGGEIVIRGVRHRISAVNHWKPRGSLDLLDFFGGGGDFWV